MINITSSISIHQPVKQVFDFICKPENDFLWQYGTLAASSHVSNSAVELGASFRSTGHFLGHRIQSSFEVTEYESNKKYGFKSLTGPLLSYTSYTFESAKDITQVNISIQASVVNLLQLNESNLEKKMKKQLKENLALLKDILEAE